MAKPYVEPEPLELPVLRRRARGEVIKNANRALNAKDEHNRHAYRYQAAQWAQILLALQ